MPDWEPTLIVRESDEDDKQECIQSLLTVLQQVRLGRVESVVMIAAAPQEAEMDMIMVSGARTCQIPRILGMLDILKVQLTRRYISELEGSESPNSVA